jgi:hypothetical protein
MSEIAIDLDDDQTRKLWAAVGDLVEWLPGQYRAWRYDHSTLAVSGPKNGVPPAVRRVWSLDWMRHRSCEITRLREALVAAGAREVVSAGASMMEDGTRVLPVALPAARGTHDPGTIGPGMDQHRLNDWVAG